MVFVRAAIIRSQLNKRGNIKISRSKELAIRYFCIAHLFGHRPPPPREAVIRQGTHVRVAMEMVVAVQSGKLLCALGVLLMKKDFSCRKGDYYESSRAIQKYF